MNTYKIKDGLSQDEIISLVRILAADEENNDRELAALLHEKKSLICVLKLNFEIQVFSLKKRKIKEIDLSEPTQLVNDILDDLRGISHQIYPKLIDQQGLIRYLESYVTSLTENNTYNVQLSLPDSEIKIVKTSEVGIFKLCVEIISLFAKREKTNIILDITTEVNFCYFSFQCDQDIPEIPEIKRKLSVIKARMLYLDANVSDETNWRNRFKFGIS